MLRTLIAFRSSQLLDSFPIDPLGGVSVAREFRPEREPHGRRSCCRAPAEAGARPVVQESARRPKRLGPGRQRGGRWSPPPHGTIVPRHPNGLEGQLPEEEPI